LLEGYPKVIKNKSEVYGLTIGFRPEIRFLKKLSLIGLFGLNLNYNSLLLNHEEKRYDNYFQANLKNIGLSLSSISFIYWF
jgi:hypothetical protein